MWLARATICHKFGRRLQRKTQTSDIVLDQIGNENRTLSVSKHWFRHRNTNTGVSVVTDTAVNHSTDQQLAAPRLSQYQRSLGDFSHSRPAIYADNHRADCEAQADAPSGFN